jgi:hypothetical protein
MSIHTLPVRHKAAERHSESQIDPRLVFLARAHARYVLVEACAMTLDEAWDGLLGPVPNPRTESLLPS